MPSHLSLKLNSSLKHLLITLPWTILGLFLLLLPYLTTSCYLSKFFVDVLHALAGLNPRKAYGPDGLPPIVLRNCASVLAPCLVKLFQLCLSTSTFPSCWKFAYIQPVPKKGDRSNPSNYRPIALISCLSKVLNLFSTRRFLNTYYFTIFYLTASMASVKATLLVILLSLLSLGHSLLKILGKLLL